MRVVQIGAGGWGSSWASIVADAPGFELAALVDLDHPTLARVGEAVGLTTAQRFSTLQEAIAAVEADVALVAVPPDAHAAVTLEALDAGLDCLVEKPLATSLADANAVVERARRAGRTVMVSQNYRFRPGARTVRGLIESGAIGRVGAAYTRFFKAPAWVTYDLEMDEPLLLNTAIHHLDAIRGVLGLEPVRVRARTFSPPWSRFAGNASAFVELEQADGTVVAYAGSLEPRGPETSWDGTWEIHGEKGWIGWDGSSVTIAPPTPDRGGRLRRRLVKRPRPPRTVPLVTLEAEDRAGVLAELAAALREEREPEASARDNLRSLAIVFAAIESAAAGEPVDVDALLASG